MKGICCVHIIIVLHILLPFLLLPDISENKSGMALLPHSLVKGDGGYLEGMVWLSANLSNQKPCQGSVSADWQLLAEKQSTAPAYAKYVHMCA